MEGGAQLNRRRKRTSSACQRQDRRGLFPFADIIPLRATPVMRPCAASQDGNDRQSP